MFHIKQQHQSAFHFENNPQQSINAFPSPSHSTIGARITNTSQSLVSLSSNAILPSSISPPSLPSSPSSSSSIALPSQSTILIIERANKKLSTGAIAGIIVGSVCLLIGLLFIALLIFLRRRNTKTNRLSIDNIKEQKVTTIIPVQNEKHDAQTSSPTSLMSHQYCEETEEDILWKAPPIGTFRAASTYTQTLDDELYIQPGDKVQIYTEYDDGWCLGINLTRGGSRGVFPQHCINIERTSSFIN